jgi:transketolase
VLIVEEHSCIGGLGESICSYMMKKGARNDVKHLAIPDQYSHYIGSQTYILDKFGMWNAQDICRLYK